MVDYYLEDRSRLNGQPKRTIGDYVEQNGILVPRRFDNLKQARRSGLPILIRSEHPQEYDGVSGLLSSWSLYRESKKYGIVSPPADSIETEEQLKEGMLNLKTDDFSTTSKARFFIKNYCAYLGIDPSEFEDEISYSLWEELGGLNRRVFADSAVLGRYHITTLGDCMRMVNYTIVEDGKILESHPRPLPIELEEGLLNLIDVYEKIRHLSNFDPIHCPIMEFQTFDGKDYFLQYHRTRDFEPMDFELDRELKQGEHRALFVRGATSPEGKVFRATFRYAGWENMIPYTKWPLPDVEEASFDIHYNYVFSEIMTRRRQAQFNELGDNVHKNTWHFLEFAAGHNNYSKLMKPGLFLSSYCERHFGISEEESELTFRRAQETGENQCVDIYVISDGKKAYVKRVD